MPGPYYQSRDNESRRYAPHSNDSTSASRLRRDLTPPERILWSKLRNKQLAGLKFRRQHQLGPYVADFYCPEVRLVVEVDGATHVQRRNVDAKRDGWMRANGIVVTRVTVREVMRNRDGVLARIKWDAGVREWTKPGVSVAGYGVDSR
ncbi:MAG: endonuclease domain-containing protein [Phycisphaerales bacterium]